MLDWNKIDTWQKFQRLINHLFALECNSPGFIPSDPYIGADEGWDGFYSGYFPPEDKEGDWSIQSKWTTKNFKEAVSDLKGKIGEELQKANKHDCNFLVIATNANLKISQIKELEELNNNEVDMLRIWAKERLTQKIEQQPFLKYYYFGDPQYPKFVPWDQHFEREKHLLSIETNKIQKFQEYVEKIREFIHDGTKNICLIHSPGGYGKSHLLRETARKFHNIDPSRQIWLIKPSSRTMEEALQDEIVDGRKYLLIFDDADRYSEEIKPLLGCCLNKGNSIKVILSMRSSGFKNIYSLINETRCEEFYTKIEIEKWAKGDLIELLRIVTGKNKIHDEESIVVTYSNPYLIVWVGRQINKKSTISLDSLREKFSNEIAYEAKQILSPFMDTNLISDFLLNIACIVPITEEDEKVFEILGKKLNMKKDLLLKALKELIRNGILRKIGRSVRFNPDMKGVLYLAHFFQDSSDTEHLKNLIFPWSSEYTEKLSINLAESNRFTQETFIVNFFTELLDSWVNNCDKTSGYERRKRLKVLSYMAYLVPEKCLDILYSYLKTKPPENLISELQDLGIDEISLSTDDYGPVILNLLGIPNIRKEVFLFIDELEKSNIEGIYDNYKPVSLIQAAVSPLHNTPESISNALDILSDWLKALTNSRINLISSALSEVLGGSHLYTEFTETKGIFGEKVLNETPEICEVRNKAIKILKEIILNSSFEFKLKGIQIIREIGISRMGHVSEEKIPLAHKIASERQDLMGVLWELIKTETNFRILNEIENIFIDWWAKRIPGTGKVAEYLRDFPRRPKYIVYKYFVSRDYVIEDFNILEKQAPLEDRWHWYVHNFTFTHLDLKPENFKELIKKLSEHYKTEAQIIDFLTDINKYILSEELSYLPPIIPCWVSSKPELFYKIRNNQVLWNKISTVFKKEIDVALAGKYIILIRRLAKEIICELPNTDPLQLNAFLSILDKYYFKEVGKPLWFKQMRRNLRELKFKLWMSKIINEGDTKARNIILVNVFYMFENINNCNILVSLILLIINKEKKLSTKLMSNLSFVIRGLETKLTKAKKSLVKKLQRDLLEKLKEISTINRETQEILKFVFGDINTVIDFIEYRLKKQNQYLRESGKGERFRAFPLQGLIYLSEHINTFLDFEKFIDKVNEWYAYDSICSYFDINSLFNSVLNIKEAKSGKLFIVEYVEKKISEGDIDRAINSARFLPISENTISIFSDIVEKGITSGKTRKIESLLLQKTFPPNTYWARIGEPPMELVERKKLFEKMYSNMSPGKPRTTIKRCIKIIDKEIREHLKEDEELLNPRM